MSTPTLHQEPSQKRPSYQTQSPSFSLECLSWYPFLTRLDYPFPTYLDLPFTAWFDSVYSTRFNSFLGYLFLFEAHHSINIPVKHQEVPHKPDCSENNQNKFVEYFKIKNNKICFGKDNLCFRTTRGKEEGQGNKKPFSNILPILIENRIKNKELINYQRTVLDQGEKKAHWANT